MKKFNVVTSTAVPLLVDHIDTDQIIPARFLKTTNKEGIGDQLFRDWRFTKDDIEIDSFVLNQEGQNGEFLLAGENFGCGSSREHAVWALTDYGFRAVFARSFADIFKQNSLNNGLLPLELTDDFWLKVKKSTEEPKSEITVSLPDQTITLSNGESQSFDIDPFRKECIINGYSDLDYLVNQQETIKQFEKQHIIPPITTV